ncbi:MAG: hypothetical protein AAF383_15795 [Cyanobacteria bacterium P01_A01_bin.83]
MYLKSFFPPSMINLWFDPIYTFVFYLLVNGFGFLLYDSESIYFNSRVKAFLGAIVISAFAVVFTRLNYYINLQLSNQNFFTTKRLIIKTVFYLIPWLLALTVNLSFADKPFYLKIVDNPLIYLIWISPYEVFEYLRLEYQKLDEVLSEKL